MIAETLSVTALWWAVIVSGLYHGLNPGMGWPLAVSAALMERKTKALFVTLAMLAFGHMVAMTAILLPFSLMVSLATWEQEIRTGAALVVIAMGVYLLINRRHPRFLARVHPGRLALWSFLAAMAHGAGLMLVPIFLAICAPSEPGSGHDAAGQLMAGNVGTAFVVAAVHTLAMTLAGAALATLMYFWLGLKFLSQTWFNLDLLWACSLILVGVVALLTIY
ncbi:Membrane protein [Sulfitobacter noctilucicola]|uniref:Uncharacterized protein n=1 Tax=Sulfitobacter noctilucicola TaxID=1342301 RepID=A0A7W6M6V0_9RHOB|nr:hypothetical protein [Sulfitobacter noctilucicola]KIN61959.1 Membrane protein [Sulfitobacter noctilucicola]MBB4173520.1 hypothetical protein [Sulfitobacter noctilucicola]